MVIVSSIRYLWHLDYLFIWPSFVGFICFSMEKKLKGHHIKNLLLTSFYAPKKTITEAFCYESTFSLKWLSLDKRLASWVQASTRRTGKFPTLWHSGITIGWWNCQRRVSWHTEWIHKCMSTAQWNYLLFKKKERSSLA